MRGGRLIAAMRGWDLSLSRRITRTDSALLDRILLPLTRAADRSVLWMGMAVPLAVLGGRFGRRAAVRGLMSIALTSAIVNVPGKLAFRRPRPIDVLPRTAALRRRPVSHSFPSGHTASAFAFATGVSLEAPRLGAPLWVLTVGVAASRIYTGLHYPSDVLVGATIGAGIALGSRRLWPVAEQDPAEIRAAAPRSAADPSPEGRGITFVVNPSAGPALAPDPVDELREALPQANIIEAGDKADFDEALKAAAEGGQAIGVAGGDGSVNVAAEAAIKNRRPLVIVPAGTSTISPGISGSPPSGIRLMPCRGGRPPLSTWQRSTGSPFSTQPASAATSSLSMPGRSSSPRSESGRRWWLPWSGCCAAPIRSMLRSTGGGGRSG